MGRRIGILFALLAAAGLLAATAGQAETTPAPCPLAAATDTCCPGPVAQCCGVPPAQTGSSAILCPAPGPTIAQPSGPVVPRRHLVPLRVGCLGPSACTGTLSIQLARKQPRSIGKRSATVRAGQTSTLHVRLTRIGRRLLARRGSLNVQALFATSIRTATTGVFKLKSR